MGTCLTSKSTIDINSARRQTQAYGTKRRNVFMSTASVLLNCDVGCGFSHYANHHFDNALLQAIDMANIPCGLHSSDPSLMASTIQQAAQYDVQIGAHPGYADLAGYGERSVACSAKEISELVVYQAGALQALCEFHSTGLSYIKPHGALYRDMMVSDQVFRAVADAASVFGVPLMIMASGDNQKYLDMADSYDVPLLFEVFADRRYEDNGRLAAEFAPHSRLTTNEAICQQVVQLVKHGYVTTLSGQQLAMETDTIGLHGLGPQTLPLIASIKAALTQP